MNSITADFTKKVKQLEELVADQDNQIEDAKLKIAEATLQQQEAERQKERAHALRNKIVNLLG